MKAKKDIENLEDIKTLVDEFYRRVRKDKLLANVFNEIIGDKWPEHLNKMYTFWQTILMNEHTYYGSPFPPHSKLPVDKDHFERWLKLFQETLDDLFDGKLAEQAKWRSERMAEMFLYKIQYYKNNASKPLV